VAYSLAKSIINAELASPKQTDKQNKYAQLLGALATWSAFTSLMNHRRLGWSLLLEIGTHSCKNTKVLKMIWEELQISFDSIKSLEPTITPQTTSKPEDREEE
jgi:hypothetical protein